MSEHKSVLLNEAIEALNIQDGGIYLDLTLGRAGHSSEILKRIPNGQLIAFDQDMTAIEESRPKLEAIGNNFELVHSNFENVQKVLRKAGVEKVDGILMDLGVSSPQFDDAERGFSYKYEAPLDMRMDRSAYLSAKEVVNEYSLEDLTKVIRTYGEDPEAYQIAKRIVKERSKSPILTTTQLADIVSSAKSRKAREKKGHPAKQTFQAIRIEVNHEMAALEKVLGDLPGMLKSGGRLVIITFHSLEDRMVKQTFHSLSVIEGDRNNVDLLPSQIAQPEYRNVVKKPVLPSEAELSENHRAASAKMRVLERK